MPIPERGFGMGIRNVTCHNLVRLWQVTRIGCYCLLSSGLLFFAYTGMIGAYPGILSYFYLSLIFDNSQITAVRIISSQDYQIII